MKYVVTTSFYEGNTLHEAGQAFEHQDQEYVQKCLADGNIAETSEGGSESATPLVENETEAPRPITVQDQPTQAPVEPTQPSPQVQVDPNVQVATPTPDQLAQDFAQTSSEPTAPPSDVHLQ